ncbi:MAG TPA: hypothetical protein VL359_17535, partial [bacterium]|nr:hypothetical protein [bacterium]
MLSPSPQDFSPSRIYTLGPAGTFSDMATQRLQQARGWHAPIEYTRTLPEVMALTESDPQALG